MEKLIEDRLRLRVVLSPALATAVATDAGRDFAPFIHDDLGGVTWTARDGQTPEAAAVDAETWAASRDPHMRQHLLGLTPMFDATRWTTLPPSARLRRLQVMDLLRPFRTSAGLGRLALYASSVHGAADATPLAPVALLRLAFAMRAARPLPLPPMPIRSRREWAAHELVGAGAGAGAIAGVGRGVVVDDSGVEWLPSVLVESRVLRALEAVPPTMELPVREMMRLGRRIRQWRAPVEVAAAASTAAAQAAAAAAAQAAAASAYASAGGPTVLTAALSMQPVFVRPETDAYDALLLLVRAMPSAVAAGWAAVAATDADLVAARRPMRPEAMQSLGELVDRPHDPDGAPAPTRPEVRAQTKCHVAVHLFLALLGMPPAPEAGGGRALSQPHLAVLGNADWEDAWAAAVDLWEAGRI